jgi:hypothetical protein
MGATGSGISQMDQDLMHALYRHGGLKRGSASQVVPVHDWTRVEDGLFHSFHQLWICAITDALNGRVLPSDFFTLIELAGGRSILQLLTLDLSRSLAFGLV